MARARKCCECAHYKKLFYCEDGEFVPAHCGRCVDPQAQKLGRVRASTKRACERFEAMDGGDDA